MMKGGSQVTGLEIIPRCYPTQTGILFLELGICW